MSPFCIERDEKLEARGLFHALWRAGNGIRPSFGLARARRAAQPDLGSNANGSRARSSAAAANAA